MSISVNSRSQTYSIARATQHCSSCGERTVVIGIVLPVGHETLEIDPDADVDKCAPDVWEVAEVGAALFYIEYLPESVLDRLCQFSQHYRTDSFAAEHRHWMNHCSFCGTGQSDFELHCEPEGAFMPISAETALAIQLYEVNEPFVAQAEGYAYAPDFFDRVQR